MSKRKPGSESAYLTALFLAASVGVLAVIAVLMLIGYAVMVAA